MSKMFFKIGLGLLAVVALLPVSGVAAENPPMPAMTVAAGLTGQAAINALGVNLSAVAAHYGRTTNELKALLNRDAAVRLDVHGNLYYICDNTPPVNGSAITNHQAPKQLFPLGQTFLLHSKPGSTKTIFLDFDGYTISGTAWNTQFNGGADIVAPPWDIDGNPGSFSANEQTIIQQVWLRVAEDYAPFDVDVTTEFPGEAALTRSDLNDQVFGTRALISPISSRIVSAGGVAFLGAFNEVGNTHKPALIFPENLANDEKYIAEAASHEVGHNLNLTHQGTSTQAYFLGHGNWAPIMGAGYYVSVSQWAKGEYQDANNQEDELAMITSTGLNYRAADFGSNSLTATAFVGVNNQTNGIISRTGEFDYFSFQTGPGNATITVTNSERGSDLHLIVGIYDPSGVSITNLETADDPTTGPRAVSVTIPVVTGKYFVSVSGKGSGNPLTDGYSSYGSLGQYTLSITNPFGNGTVVSAPRPPWGTTLNVMNGSNPNGAWLLFVQDDKPLDVGVISNGWSVALTSANPVGFASDNQLLVSPALANVTLGGNWTMTFSITNYGPSIATNILVTDDLPIGAGLSFAGAVPSVGSLSQFGSTLLWNIPTLAINAGAQLNVTFNASVLGTYTNSATVSGAGDPNPDDDTAMAMANVSVFSPPAFASVTFSSGHPTISVTNAGAPMSVIIQATTNLANAFSWLPIYTNTTPFSFTDLNATNYPYRFYRSLLGP